MIFCLQTTFSILTRIDTPATLNVLVHPVNVSYFQYPHTDRYPCNREEIQRHHHQKQAFSILTRIDTPATIIYKFVQTPSCQLSVSSHASIPLQPSQR